jgi:hypothetical protein
VNARFSVDFHLLSQVVAEFHFARRMKFISHRRVLLHENEVAVRLAHTTPYRCLSLRRFRVVRAPAIPLLLPWARETLAEQLTQTRHPLRSSVESS